MLSKKRNFSRDELYAEDNLEIEDDIVYFKYNTDGDDNFHFDDKQSEL